MIFPVVTFGVWYLVFGRLGGYRGILRHDENDLHSSEILGMTLLFYRYTIQMSIVRLLFVFFGTPAVAAIILKDFLFVLVNFRIKFHYGYIAIVLNVLGQKKKDDNPKDAGGKPKGLVSFIKWCLKARVGQEGTMVIDRRVEDAESPRGEGNSGTQENINEYGLCERTKASSWLKRWYWFCIEKSCMEWWPRSWMYPRHRLVRYPGRVATNEQLAVCFGLAAEYIMVSNLPRPREENPSNTTDKELSSSAPSLLQPLPDGDVLPPTEEVFTLPGFEGVSLCPGDYDDIDHSLGKLDRGRLAQLAPVIANVQSHIFRLFVIRSSSKVASTFIFIAARLIFPTLDATSTVYDAFSGGVQSRDVGIAMILLISDMAEIGIVFWSSRTLSPFWDFIHAPMTDLWTNQIKLVFFGWYCLLTSFLWRLLQSFTVAGEELGDTPYC